MAFLYILFISPCGQLFDPYFSLLYFSACLHLFNVNLTLPSSSSQPVDPLEVLSVSFPTRKPSGSVCSKLIIFCGYCLVYLVFIPYFPSGLWLIIYIYKYIFYIWKYKDIKESLPGVVVYDCNANTQEVEAGGLRISWDTE